MFAYVYNIMQNNTMNHMYKLHASDFELHDQKL